MAAVGAPNLMRRPTFFERLLCGARLQRSTGRRWPISALAGTMSVRASCEGHRPPEAAGDEDTMMLVVGRSQSGLAMDV